MFKTHHSIENPNGGIQNQHSIIEGARIKKIAEILLGSYYKYGTYKCYSPIFLDSTVRIFEKYLRKSEQYV